MSLRGFLVRHYLPLSAVASGLVVIALAVYFSGDTGGGNLPTAATCRQLAADPVEYAGRTVVVRTGGCTRENSHRLVWRPFADSEPAVVLEFPGGVPEDVPPEVVGYCRAPRAGGPVTVANCRRP